MVLGLKYYSDAPIRSPKKCDDISILLDTVPALDRRMDRSAVTIKRFACTVCWRTIINIQCWGGISSAGFLRQKSYKIQGFSTPFHSIIQGQFNALLPVNHSIAYSPTDTQEKRCTDLKHWCAIFIRKTVWAVLLPDLQLWQFTQSPRNFHDRQIPNFSRPSILFPKQFKAIFSFLKFKDFSRTFQGWPWIQDRCRNHASSSHGSVARCWTSPGKLKFDSHRHSVSHWWWQEEKIIWTKWVSMV